MKKEFVIVKCYVLCLAITIVKWIMLYMYHFLN